MSTADAVLQALQRFGLKDEGSGQWRSNSPLRPSSNSHCFTLKIDDGEHGAWHDHVSGEKGSLYDLADVLGIQRPKPASATPSTTVPTDLDSYAAAHGVTGDVFRRFGWGEKTGYQGRPALPFFTATGIKYRFLDGRKPKFKPAAKGYQACWYWLDRAVQLAVNQPLVITNGEPSTVVAQHFGVAATALTAGENKPIPAGLLQELQAVWTGPIVIALDCDAAGVSGAHKRKQQLLQAGFQVRAVDLGGGAGFDLADFCRLHTTNAAAALQALPDLPAPARDVLTDANKSDAGNAECLAALHGERLRFDHTRGRWLVWDDQRWRTDANGHAVRLALETVRARYQAAAKVPHLDERKKLATWAVVSESTAKITALLQAAESQRPFTTTVDQYDRDPLRASTHSGTLDLRTGTLHAAERTDYITMQLGTTFDPHAPCSRWERFMHEVFAGDLDLIAFVQRAVGYSLTGDTREQKLFLCWGSGANGKSVFLKVLEWLLGDYAANASFETFDANKRNETSNDLAMLRGKRLVTIIETNEDRRLDEAKVKAVTGGDSITCRFLYGEFFSYTPQFKIWLAMNYKPVIRGTDRGIWRRMILIPFTQSFEGRAEPGLLNTLRAEHAGILNWALAGLAAWRQQGLGQARAVTAATEEYRRESDEIGKWLLETCVDDPQSILISLEAYANYHLWARERGERYPMTQTAWGRSMGERGYKTRRQVVNRRQVTVYLGLRLRTDQDP